MTISEGTYDRKSEPTVIFNGLFRSKLASLTETVDVWALARTTGAIRLTPNVTVWLAELEVCAQVSTAATPTTTERANMYRISFIGNSQFVSVSVTTRASASICPTDAFAANVYVIV